MHAFLIRIETETAKVMRSIISILLPLISFCYVVVPIPPPYSSFRRINLPPGLSGPEAVTLDPRGGGPYVVVTDGRILKWQDSQFIDFATTSPTRTKQLCDGTTDPNLGPVCGRPLAFSFNTITGDLYITDAYLGLHVVGPNGGLATLLANSAEGVPFCLLNGVDVDLNTGIVYFADSSSNFQLWNATQPNFASDTSGRLLRYNPRSREVRVLVRGLAAAVGPAVSADSSYVIVSERFASRITRFWISGPRRNSVDVFLNVQGSPRKIKRSPLGGFWVALNCQYLNPSTVVPQGLRVNRFGAILQTLNFQDEYFNTTIGLVQEQINGSLYVGSRNTNFIGIYSL